MIIFTGIRDKMKRSQEWYVSSRPWSSINNWGQTVAPARDATDQIYHLRWLN